MTDNAVIEFRKRREKRLAARGYRTKLNEYRNAHSGKMAEKKEKSARAVESGTFNMDASADDKQNNQQGGSGGTGGGGHGNTRLPFGLCKRFGIEVESSWTPKDAWAALAGKGITVESAYSRLKQGKDPGRPFKGAEPEKPKEPKKTFTSHGKEFSELKGKKYMWSEDPYRLEAHGEDDHFYRSFHTKADLMKFLREKGVEEFEDPDTGEIVDPTKMELPESKFGVSEFGKQTYYKGVTIGMRKGKYTVIGTGLEGKKETMGEFRTLKSAQDYLEKYGVASDDIKLSPALKKVEKERLAWKDSDKKEFYEKDGVKYGDLKLEQDYYTGRWILKGSAEDGTPLKLTGSESKAEMMNWLKVQGIEGIKIDGEKVNPVEYEIPKTIAVIGGRKYQKLEVRGGYENLAIYGTDIDGRTQMIGYARRHETYDDFLGRMEALGASKESITVPEDMVDVVERKKKDDQEVERRHKEFESKAIDVAGDRYMDVRLEKDGDYYRITGFDRDGHKTSISSRDDMYTMDKLMTQYGLKPDELIQDDETRKAYEEYLKYKADYESKAFTFLGHRYADVRVIGSESGYKVVGKDIRGRERVMFAETDYEDFKRSLEDAGIPESKVPLDDKAKEIREKDLAIKKAMESGEYYRQTGKREAFKDLYMDRDSDGKYRIMGTDTSGEKGEFAGAMSYDDAIEKLESMGVPDYKIRSGGKVFDRPTDGMRGVILMRSPSGFKVMATVGKGESKEVYSSGSEEEARKWISDNGVDTGSIKTRGMNPNDDVPRTHTQASLASFDAYRMQKVENSFINDMTDDEKTLAAEMLTEIFDKGAYRVARSTGSFGGIIEEGYKSQIETGSGGSGAAIGKDMRKTASMKFFGHGGLNDTEYEKCGYIGLSDEGEDWDDGDHPRYGGLSPMTYTLKKETMKDRTTYTYGDSLNTDYRMSSAGYAGDKPTLEGLTSLYNLREVRNALRAFKQYQNGDITYQEMFKKIRSEANNNYIELQFHGPVTVKDIEKVSFNKTSDMERAFEKMTAKRRANVIKLLQENQIKIEYRDGYKPGATFQDGWDWVRKKYPEYFAV